MIDPRGQLRKGTTALVVLSALARGEVYGYELRRHVFTVTHGVFGLKEGSLYPQLHALQRQGLISARGQKVKGRWRKYYRLTAAGRRSLALWQAEWNSLRKALAAVVGGAP